MNGTHKPLSISPTTQPLDSPLRWDRPMTPKGGDMDIMRNGSQPSSKGPSDWFTGSVRIDSRFQRNAPARVGGAIVTFEPGGRTAWHTHPLGQTLIVIFGCGRCGAKEDRSRKSAPATSSGSSRVRNTGTAPPLRLR